MDLLLGVAKIDSTRQPDPCSIHLKQVWVCIKQVPGHKRVNPFNLLNKWVGFRFQVIDLFNPFNKWVGTGRVGSGYNPLARDLNPGALKVRRAYSVSAFKF